MIVNDLDNLYEDDLFNFCSSSRKIKTNSELNLYLNFNFVKENFSVDPLKNCSAFPKLAIR